MGGGRWGRRRRGLATRLRAAAAPDPPDYDVVGPFGGGLELGAVACDAAGWSALAGEGYGAQAYVSFVDGGVTLYDAGAGPADAQTLVAYREAWRQSPAAALPGARAPLVALTVDAGAVVPALQAARAVVTDAPDLVLVRGVEEGADAARLAQELAAMRAAGCVKGFVGLAGVPPGGVAVAEKLKDALAATPGAPALAAVKVRYSLAERAVELDGTLDALLGLGVAVLAEAPLAGVLGGDDGLGKLLGLVGSFNGGRTAAQVALNYLMSRGAVPLAAASGAESAWELVGAQEWRLDDNSLEVLAERAQAAAADA